MDVGHACRHDLSRPEFLSQTRRLRRSGYISTGERETSGEDQKETRAPEGSNTARGNLTARLRTIGDKRKRHTRTSAHSCTTSHRTPCRIVPVVLRHAPPCLDVRRSMCRGRAPPCCAGVTIWSAGGGFHESRNSIPHPQFHGSSNRIKTNKRLFPLAFYQIQEHGSTHDLYPKGGCLVRFAERLAHVYSTCRDLRWSPDRPTARPSDRGIAGYR